MSKHHEVHIFVNHKKLSFESPKQTGQSIKEKASIPLCDVLCAGRRRGDDHKDHSDAHQSDAIKDCIEVANDHVVVLENGQHFWSHKAQKGVEVTINRVKYLFDHPVQTGRSLKERAGIDLADVLFRSRPSEDEVVANDTKITLRCDDCFYSSPPANYGLIDITPNDVGCDQFECIPQPQGWTFLVISNFILPKGYSQDRTQLLVKLPPGFPDAAPDMFWVNPHLNMQSGGIPQGTSMESLLGQQWQRFSWHLKPGAWRPGVSTLRDFMRCVRSRFECRN